MTSATMGQLIGFKFLSKLNLVQSSLKTCKCKLHGVTVTKQKVSDQRGKMAATDKQEGNECGAIGKHLHHQYTCHFNHCNQVHYKEQRNSETKNFQDVTKSKTSVYIVQWQTDILKKLILFSSKYHPFPFCQDKPSVVQAPSSPAQQVRSERVRTQGVYVWWGVVTT